MASVKGSLATLPRRAWPESPEPDVAIALSNLARHRSNTAEMPTGPRGKQERRYGLPRPATSSQMHLRSKVGARCTGHPFVLYTGALVNGVTMLVVELAVVVGLIVLNGFLAMSELALVSARRPLLEQMARDGSRGAAVACCPPCRSASPW